VEAERQRLFTLMRELASATGPSASVLEEAQAEIRRSVGDGVTVLDPFAGGGSIPIEAQRLGLNVEASDLNPVALLLNRLLLDQVRAALNRAAVHPAELTLGVAGGGKGLAGLAEDVVWYGKRLRELTKESVGSLYPAVRDLSGREFPVISWIWARTVTCSNPACRRPAPLAANFWLSKKKGRERWLEPVVGEPGEPICFSIRTGSSGPATTGSKTGRGVRFKCLGCGEAITEEHIRSSGSRGEMGLQLMAIAALGDRRREYFPAESDSSPALSGEHELLSELEVELPHNPRAISPPGYGMSTHRSLYTRRQNHTLLTMCELLPSIRQEILKATSGDENYSNLVVTMLGVCVSKLADLANSFCAWEPSAECPRHLFTRQAIPMVWDFAEGNPLGDSSGSLMTIVENTARALRGPLVEYLRPGNVFVNQSNASTREYPNRVVVCTDPPYFDNIGYADVADFFYVWLRLALRDIHPDLFSTLLTPKVEELVAIPYRHDDGKVGANRHFETGFRSVFSQIKSKHHSDIPMTVFYAYKQEDDEGSDDEISSTGAGATGWEKLLQGMVDSGLQVTATWPIRTEMASRMVGRGTNALASSVVLACRPRPNDAGITDRQGFIRHLRREMAGKLPELQSGGVQPVDMAQASIGPGMAVFTSYAKVLEGGDKQMSVGTALQIINQVLDELQSEQESEFDSDTRWAVSWFTQNGLNSGDFGDAQNIATARGTAVNGLERSGIIEARAGRVRLLARSEYANDWDPTTDKRITVWEVCQHLIRRVEGDGGLMAAASLLRQVGSLGEAARDLAYRLYEIANRNGWSEEARAYNNLAAEWPDLVALSAQAPSDPSTLF
jgi:putative DNA methylase